MARQSTPVLAGVPSVNLLPRPEIERRERETLLGKWIWGVLGAVILAAALVGGAFVINWFTEQSLASEQANTNSLLVQISSLSGVSRTLATKNELESFRADAMGSDFAWTPVFTKVSSVLPSGVTITGFALNAGASPSSGIKARNAVGLTGTITFTSTDPINITPVIRGLRTVPGVMGADGQSLTSSSTALKSGAPQNAYTYLLNVTFDQTIYSGAYEQGSK